ncbi:MAG TPA: alpha/beta hydrolase, partial [Casimicrobiaceae bacterium]|nr:alpha/beta hydrolase [Casimicrobiaceae bacterium]
YVRTVSAPFGPLTDAQWEHVVRTNARLRPDGRWGLGYDPGIAVPFRAQPAPPALWPLWDAIRCPTLVLRGAESDLLSGATAAEMSRRGPCPQVIEFAGVGHAPALLDSGQVEVVARFLRNV